MDKPTATTDALISLIARMQPEIDAANKALEAATAALKVPGSEDDKRKLYLHLRVLRGTYSQGFEIADDACERLFPGHNDKLVVIEPINPRRRLALADKPRPRLTLVPCRESDDP